MSELAFLSARDLLSRFGSKELSPVEVTRNALDRIDTLNPKINAVYDVQASTAMHAAKQSETRWLKGEPVGPLDGLVTTVKDALPLAGRNAYRGSAANPPERATTDHPTVARMREAGAIFLGKNTMCDYGIIAAGISSKHGVTRNPWDLQRTCGASSSGSAATLAAGIGPLSIGTDIVGSIRVPASYCGLVGLKPSRGRVPYHFPNHPALTAGPMARDVSDAALLLEVLARPDCRDFTALPFDDTPYLSRLSDLALHKKRARLVLDLGLGVKPDPETVLKVSLAAAAFDDFGFDIELIDQPPFVAGADDPATLHYKVRCLAEFESLPEAAQKRSPVIYDWVEDARSVTATDLYRAGQDLLRLEETAYGLMGDADFLLLPSTPIPAHEAELPSPPGTDLFAPWCNTFLFNLTGQPALSINCGFSKSGLPIGLQIVGRRGDDLGVLQLGKAWEDIVGFPVPWAQSKLQSEAADA